MVRRTLERRLRRESEGDVLFDDFSRGRYSTDASIYQITPVGIVLPRTVRDIESAVSIAHDLDVPIIPRGAGTSQSGQAIGSGLIIDTSKYLRRVLQFDLREGTVAVEPGIVLDELNRFLKPHNVFFPVDPATANQATLGGMAGNNSAGARSLRYGLMADNVAAIEAILDDGRTLRFAHVPADLSAFRSNGSAADARLVELTRRIRDLHEREATELERQLPQVLRHVAGYNLHRVDRNGHNLAHILVGSEGTLGIFTRLDLTLAPIPRHRVLGVCHFPTLTDAMVTTPRIVDLGPAAVELVDHTLIDLARANESFRASVDRFIVGSPRALLLTEFAGDDRDVQLAQLDALDELMADLGFPNSVVRAIDSGEQQEIWNVRRAGLNIVMSMKGEGKPVSFIEDCAVPLEHLAEYTERLGEVFERHGTSGTWYAHASVGCLHVRPTLNLKDPVDVSKMRQIAEEAHALVRSFKGSHSGEHGDGIVRSEFIEPMLGGRLARAFEEIKDLFDPFNLFNPGKIVRPPRMDDRTLFRYSPTYAPTELTTALDWQDTSGWLGAVEMCNNNGTCRRLNPGVMCPSFRVTADEEHTTRGRANVLRLALTGQLGHDALTSQSMYEAMDLCVGCKACRRECPMGIDMARMKVEFLHHYNGRNGIPLADRLVAYLPRYAALAARLPSLSNLRNRVPGLARLGERWLGISAKRALPSWRRDVFRPADPDGLATNGSEVALFVDTFDRYFEPENANAAVQVLRAAGYRVTVPEPAGGGRPLCCGRTFLNAGMIDHAREEARRTLEALIPIVDRGIPIVGLEPSCTLTLRDEFLSLLPGKQSRAVASATKLLEEFLLTDPKRHRERMALRPLPDTQALIHGHCHQKAFGLSDATLQVLRWIPGLSVEQIESGCCGMAGSFGYEAKHHDLSLKMAELSLLPAIRSAPPSTHFVACGTSCRHQIADGTGREAVHAARVLCAALP